MLHKCYILKQIILGYRLTDFQWWVYQLELKIGVPLEPTQGLHGIQIGSTNQSNI